MSDTEKLKALDDTAELNGLTERGTPGTGRIEYDELGNAVWVPYKNLGAAETLARLLNDDSLAISEDESRGNVVRVQENPAGLRKGYNPYDSGLLVKKQYKKKKDLRALSDWIKSRKQADQDE